MTSSPINTNDQTMKHDFVPYGTRIALIYVSTEIWSLRDVDTRTDFRKRAEQVINQPLSQRDRILVESIASQHSESRQG